MNALNSLENRLRGWIPKEPTLQFHQVPVDPKNSPIIRWTARAFVAGAVAYVGLLIAGDVAGLTSGVGAYIWPIAVFGVTLAPVGAVPFLVKRKTNPERRTQT